MPANTFANSGHDLIGQTIDNGRLEIISTLGVGAYGVVYLAIDLQAPTPVYLAVKCLLRAGLDSRQRHFQRREIALHQLASKHPGVVTLHKVLEEGDFVFVIMDFYDEGDLFATITERQRYLGNDALIRKVFLQILDAVEYCHSMGIFHRDLKPENILVTRDGQKVCIADFGLATSEKISTDFGCGSTFYLSPECQGGIFERLEQYSTEHNDLWSLGVILVNLTCGRNPWRQATPSDETFRAFVHNPEFLRTILPISHQTNQILQGLFALEPSQRTSLRRLRRQVLAVETFTMTDEELRYAHSAARAAAAAVRQGPQPQPRPQQKVRPVQVTPRAPVVAKVTPTLVAAPVIAAIPPFNPPSSRQPVAVQSTYTPQIHAQFTPRAPQSAQVQPVMAPLVQDSRPQPRLVIQVDSDSDSDSSRWSNDSMYDQYNQHPDSEDTEMDDDSLRFPPSPRIVTPPSTLGKRDPFVYDASPRSISSEDPSLPPTPQYTPADKSYEQWIEHELARRHGQQGKHLFVNTPKSGRRAGNVQVVPVSPISPTSANYGFA